MSEFVFYAEKSAFDEMTFYGHYPNMKKILTSNTAVVLNISEAELQQDIDSQGEIFQFLNANAGARRPIAYIAPFENIADDRTNLVAAPRSIYILNVTSEEAAEMQMQYGVLVQSATTMDDSVFESSFFRELSRDEVIEENARIGWKQLLNFHLPPSNSIVISDSHLFKNSDRVGEQWVSVGEKNVIWLLDKVLPGQLMTTYHITIISEKNANKPEQWYVDLTHRLEQEIRQLRGYEIDVEVIFLASEHLHKRRIIMNYINGSCDKGFAVFRAVDGKTVRDNNDIRLSRAFAGITGRIGDTEFNSATRGLQQIKNENTRIRGAGANIRNRLINDV